jgi:hypothetical protein
MDGIDRSSANSGILSSMMQSFQTLRYIAFFLLSGAVAAQGREEYEYVIIGSGPGGGTLG